jgi:hypothetical protein
MMFAYFVVAFVVVCSAIIVCSHHRAEFHGIFELGCTHNLGNHVLMNFTYQLICVTLLDTILLEPSILLIETCHMELSCCSMKK